VENLELAGAISAPPISGEISVDKPADIFEKAIIGSLLLVGSDEARKVAASCGPELFYTPRNKHAWSILQAAALGGNPLGVDTAVATIEQAPSRIEYYDAYENAVRNHIDECVRASDKPRSWRGYVESLELVHMRRTLITALDEAQSAAFSHGTKEGVRDAVIGRVMEAVKGLKHVTEGDAGDIVKTVHNYREGYDDYEYSIPFPQAHLNTIGGFRPGNIVIMTALTGVGKSFWGIDLASCNMYSGPVWYYTLEMTKGQIIDRLISMRSGFDLTDIILRRMDIEELDSSLENIVNSQLRIIDGYVTSESIISDISSVDEEDRPRVVIVDHLHLLEGSDDIQKLNKMCTAFKVCAVENNVPIVLLAQMRRPDGIKSDNIPRPRKEYLKNSSAIEQIADFIIMLHRTKQDSGQFIYSMWTDKQRDGVPANDNVVRFEGYQFRTVQ